MNGPTAMDLCVVVLTLECSWVCPFTKVGTITSLGDKLSICGDTFDGFVTGVMGNGFLFESKSKCNWCVSFLLISVDGVEDDDDDDDGVFDVLCCVGDDVVNGKGGICCCGCCIFIKNFSRPFICILFLFFIGFFLVLLAS